MMPLMDKWTAMCAMWCWLARVLYECQVWASLDSPWLCFCFVQVTTHTLLFSSHQQQTLLQKNFFKFLDTPVNLEYKLWMYL